MPKSEQVARKVAQEMRDLLGGSENWLRPDVLAQLERMCRGYDLVDSGAIAAELIASGYRWSTLADPCYGRA